MVGFWIARRVGWDAPPFFASALRVALAAAVGFLTNWLAIEMLFKPYERVDWLWIWPQGLVPRNKVQIGVKAGETIATELLCPETIADKLCGTLSEYARRGDTKERIARRALELIDSYRDDIIATVAPVAESEIIKTIRRFATREQLELLWERQIVPRLADERTQKFLAERITQGLKDYAPQLTITLRKWLGDYIRRYLVDIMPKIVAETISVGIIEFIDWDNIETELRRNLGEPQTFELIKKACVQQGEKFQEWLRSPESHEKVERFLVGLRAQIEAYARQYLKNDFPELIRGILVSPKVWRWIDERVVPQAQPVIEYFVRENAPKIIEKINFQGIISDAIDRQDMRKFHDMINDVAAEHLGAIQVLGYFLGGLVGMMQV